MSFIKATKISKVYGDSENEAETVALNKVSLEIEKGEFVALVGPSGSGKSTLMHILGLLDRPSEGEYHFDGQLVGDLDDNQLAYLRRDKIGFIFQQFNLMARSTALQNVMLPMIYSNTLRDARIQRAKELLEIVDLSDREDHMPSELSGGQMQRVAIARALANDPDLLFADEPTGNLDTKSGKHVMDHLKKLNKKGTTLILVTHEDQLAKQADRIIKIKDGKLSTKAQTAVKKRVAKPKSRKKSKK